jgi:phosphomannomutase
MVNIKFGTSGWRGIIADDFTFANVKLVTRAIAEYLKTRKLNRPVIVGYDTRFASADFARTAANVLAANNHRVYLCEQPTPTPVISIEILRRKLSGGLNFTASHNPPQYNGLKFSPEWGGPALPETTQQIEQLCRKNISATAEPTVWQQKLIKKISAEKNYLKILPQLLDFPKNKKCTVVVDPLYGTAIPYFAPLLRKYRINYMMLHTESNPLFGGKRPEPNEENLSSLKILLRQKKAILGLATDGDADRFGILDRDGSFLNPNEILSLLFYYLVKNKRLSGKIVVRSVMTTHLLDKLAKHFHLEVKETPVGFKFIGEELVKANSVYPHRGGDFLIGGEESGGLTIQGHIPEKDGILANLLVLEMVLRKKKSCRQILKEIFRLVGPTYDDRLNFHLNAGQMDKFRQRLKHPENLLTDVAVKNIITMDGYKFLLADKNCWLGVRLSGTEPVVRLYAESDSPKKQKKLITAGRKIIFGK